MAAETLDRDEKDRVVRWLLICRMDWDRLLRGFLGVMKEFSLCAAKEPSLGLWWSSMVGVEGDDVLLMIGDDGGGDDRGGGDGSGVF